MGARTAWQCRLSTLVRVPKCLCVHAFSCAALYLLMPVRTQQLYVNTRYNGPVETCNQVAQKTKLRFTWHLTAAGINETCDVQLTCQNAARRGVHLPPAWKRKRALGGTGLSCDALAREAVQRVRDEFSLSEDVKLDCRHPFFAKYVCSHLSVYFPMRAKGMLATLVLCRCAAAASTSIGPLPLMAPSTRRTSTSDQTTRLSGAFPCRTVGVARCWRTR